MAQENIKDVLALEELFIPLNDTYLVLDRKRIKRSHRKTLGQTLPNAESDINRLKLYAARLAIANEEPEILNFYITITLGYLEEAEKVLLRYREK